jgi:hypothetical protein
MPELGFPFPRCGAEKDRGEAVGSDLKGRTPLFTLL